MTKRLPRKNGSSCVAATVSAMTTQPAVQFCKHGASQSDPQNAVVNATLPMSVSAAEPKSHAANADTPLPG